MYKDQMYEDEITPPLLLAIEHWRRMSVGDTSQNDEPVSDQCALCKCFNVGREYCERCPVFKHTGLRMCENTPYEAVLDIWGSNDDAMIQENFKAAAEAEYQFLLSLLPEDKRLKYLASIVPTPQSDTEGSVSLPEVPGWEGARLDTK